jgi:hypothetical protein
MSSMKNRSLLREGLGDLFSTPSITEPGHEVHPVEDIVDVWIAVPILIGLAKEGTTGDEPEDNIYLVAPAGKWREARDVREGRKKKLRSQIGIPVALVSE